MKDKKSIYENRRQKSVHFPSLLEIWEREMSMMRDEQIIRGALFLWEEEMATTCVPEAAAMIPDIGDKYNNALE